MKGNQNKILDLLDRMTIKKNSHIEALADLMERELGMPNYAAKIRDKGLPNTVVVGSDIEKGACPLLLSVAPTLTITVSSILKDHIVLSWHDPIHKTNPLRLS